MLSIRIGSSGPEDIKSLTNNFESVPYLQPNDLAESPTMGSVYNSDPNFKGKTLYVTCDKKVYSLAMNVKGAQFK